MVNRYRPHVVVLPEDTANLDVANGFVLHVDRDCAIQVLGPAGGWDKARDDLLSDHVQGLRRLPERRLVLLIDFDDDLSRRGAIRDACPGGVADRVFVIGTNTEVEELRRDLVGEGVLRPNTLEGIGELLAADCRAGTDDTWSHPRLAHNADEYARMRVDLRPILFDV